MSQDAEIQIKAMFEDGMPIQDIAETLRYNESAVHLALQGRSKEYGRMVQDGSIVVPEEDVQEAYNTIVGLMKDPEVNARNRFSMARWVIDEATGRNAVKAAIPQVNTSVVIIQDRLNKFKRLREKYTNNNKGAIDVEETKRIAEDAQG